MPAKKPHCSSEPTAGERGVGRARVSLRKDRKHTRAHGAKRAKNVQFTFVRLLVRGDPPKSLGASWLTFGAAFGAGWPTCTPGAARALVSLASIVE